jgi:site-specific recombinase XerD
MEAKARRIVTASHLRDPLSRRDRALLDMLYATGLRARS